MVTRIFEATIYRDGSTCFIPISFDPRAAFGKVRAPVKVTLNGHSYRSTIAAMGKTVCIPLRKSHREAAGLQGNEKVRVKLELEAIEGARKKETRARRLEAAVRMIAARPRKKTKSP